MRDAPKRLENRKEHGIDKTEYRHDDIDSTSRVTIVRAGLLFENHRQN